MYDKLVERLQNAGRLEWALEECALLGDIERYRADERRAYLRIPGAMRMNRRELGVLNELVKLRDRIARERDLPLKYVMPDDVVGGLATLRPKAASKISTSCGASMPARGGSSARNRRSRRARRGASRGRASRAVRSVRSGRTATRWRR